MVTDQAKTRISRSRMSVLSALVLLATVVAASPARALTCPAVQPTIQVTVKLADPVIDNTLPQPALQQIAGKGYHRGRTLGLYRAQIQTRWRARVGQREDNGEACRWIEGVAIEIVAPERTIYIVRARPPGTCWYDTVLKHERKHQATDDAVIAEFAPRLEREVARALDRLPPPKPVAMADAAAAQRRLMAPVDAAIGRVLQALEAARHTRQAGIDTPQEYRRVGAACG